MRVLFYEKWKSLQEWSNVLQSRFLNKKKWNSLKYQKKILLQWKDAFLSLNKSLFRICVVSLYFMYVLCFFISFMCWVSVPLFLLCRFLYFFMCCVSSFLLSVVYLYFFMFCVSLFFYVLGFFISFTCCVSLFLLCWVSSVRE